MRQYDKKRVKNSDMHLYVHVQCASAHCGHGNASIMAPMRQCPPTPRKSGGGQYAYVVDSESPNNAALKQGHFDRHMKRRWSMR
jgi:hypothetical protein